MFLSVYSEFRVAGACLWFRHTACLCGRTGNDRHKKSSESIANHLSEPRWRARSTTLKRHSHHGHVSCRHVVGTQPGENFQRVVRSQLKKIRKNERSCVSGVSDVWKTPHDT